MSEYKPRVAVIGLNGALGKHVLNSLTSSTFINKFTLPIVAITRSIPTDIEKNDKIKYVAGSIDNKESLLSAYKNIDVVIDIATINVSHHASVDAAVENKVKLYIPSEFGSDYNKNPNSEFKPAFSPKIDTINYAKSKGLKTIQIITGFFTEWFVPGPFLTGLDTEKATFQLYGDGKITIATTSLVDVGNVVASVASKSPKDLPEIIRVQGSTPTYLEIADFYEHYTGRKLDKKEPISIEQTYQNGKDTIKKGITGFEDFAKILLAIAVSGEGNDFTGHVDNELVNPKQSLWKWIDWKSVSEKIWTK